MLRAIKRWSHSRRLKTALRGLSTAAVQDGGLWPKMRKNSIRDPTECPKRDEDWRLVAININGFPTEANGEEKAKRDRLKDLITRGNVDIAGLTETARNERKIPHKRRPTTIIKHWNQGSQATADWLRSSTSSHETGGVMLFSSGRSAAHKIDQGTDEREIGRWAWSTYKGKRNKKVTIITTYRPTNLQATAMKQLRVIRTQDCESEPEEIWKQDLEALINGKKLEGGVIVMGDFNDNLNSPSSKINVMFHSLQMREVLNQRYGEGPPTYFRGSNKIDGIFVTADIEITQGGYVGDETAPGDHLCPWIDVAQEDMIGEPRDDKPPPLMRKATSKIPSVKNEFNRILNEKINLHMLEIKAVELMEAAKLNGALTTEQEAEYDTIEEILKRAVKCTDRQCRKARMGHVPFSQKQKELQGAIIILKKIFLRHKLKGKSRPSMKKLKRDIKK